jgi:hypothetical protein
MRGMIMGCCAVCAGGAFMYGGNSGIDYDGPVQAVHAELAAMRLPEEFAESVNSDGRGSVRVNAGDPQEVSWHFNIDGQELGKVTAVLTAKDADTTNVQVEWDPGEDLPKGSSARAVAMQPLVEQVSETFMAEQIDATLEDRPFDKRAVGLQLAGYVASHPREMKQYMAKVQSLAEDAKAMGNSDWEPRVRGESRPPEAQFRPGKPMVSARPMSDLSGYNQ